MSVVVRSFERLPALCELLDRLLALTHDSFEIVVVEQSSSAPPERLAILERDPRVRMIRRPPLGGARARNVGVAHARGDILVFIDDDDLPEGPDFLADLERSFADPRCLGVTCRHLWGEPAPVSRWYAALAQRRSMRFSPVLRLPYVYARQDDAVRGCDYVHGTGGALRRSVIERFGGWDEDTPIEDESSLGFRILRGRGADEYLAFDPRARLQRRMDLDGGLGKRRQTSGKVYRKWMTFVHRVIGRYHPIRTRALYPLYVLAVMYCTLSWIWSDSTRHDTALRRAIGTAAFLVAAPWHAITALGVRFGRSRESSRALHAGLLSGS